MRLNNIEFGNRIFEWGFDFVQTKSLFDIDTVFSEESQNQGNFTLRIGGALLWGIPYNACDFSAPDMDRAINKVQFSLLSIRGDRNFILSKLESVFGARASENPTYNAGNNKCAYSCRWYFENCQVELTIYKTDVEPNEYAFGEITFYLTGLELLYKLYASTWECKSKNLETNLQSRNFRYRIFSLSQSQRQSWEVEQYKYPQHDSDYISVVFNSYYKRELLKAPNKLRNLLKDNEVCIFSNPVNGKTYIGNKWESYLPDNVEAVTWTNILPAKGPGWNSVTLGDFSIIDLPGSLGVESLINELDSGFGKRAVVHKGFDF